MAGCKSQHWLFFSLFYIGSLCASAPSLASSFVCVSVSTFPALICIVRPSSSAKLSWKEQKEQQAKQRKKENEIKRIEEQIERLENRDAEIDGQMAKPDICTNVAKLQELAKEKEGILTQLNDLMERWEILESED